MADETKIELKLEKELDGLEKIYKKLEEVIKHEFDEGVEHINTHEMGEVIDMLKDVSVAKEKLIKGCYYKQIMEAMEKSEYGEDYNEDGPMDEPRYYNAYRYANGRYAPKGRGTRRGYEEPRYHMPIEYMYPSAYYRDMDRTDGRMYYSGDTGTSSDSTNSSMGNTRGYSDGYSDGYSEGQRANRRDSREGRSGMSRRSYMESKELHSDNTQESKQAKMKELEKYMSELSSDMTDMINGASNEEKTMLKQKLQNLSNKIV